MTGHPNLKVVASNPEFRRAANTAPNESTTTEIPSASNVGYLAGRRREYEYERFLGVALREGPRTVGQQVEYNIGRQQSELDTDGDEMAAPTREEIDAKLETVAARTDTKVATLEGKMDLVLSKLDDMREDNKQSRHDAREANRHTQNITVSVGIGLALLIIGVVAAAPVIFDLGSKFRESISKEIQERMPHPAPL